MREFVDPDFDQYKHFRNAPPEFFSEDPTAYVPNQNPPTYQPADDIGIEDHHAVELPSTTEKQRLGNDTLPVFNFRDQIVDAVKNNQISIIVAETGAGKSTQVPQFLLDAGWDTVYLTQPRRAAARNVHNRIYQEIEQVWGSEDAEQFVSFQTAEEREGPENARIRVVTDGLHLVRELNDAGIVENDVLIIDEVHEWGANVEILVAWVREITTTNPNLRVVLMSATMDAEALAEYFDDVCVQTPPIIEIPGRTFAVERSEKPDSTVVEEALIAAQAIIDGSEDAANGIMIAVPGKREVADIIDEIAQRLPPEIAAVATILPLHAKLTPNQQQAAIASYPGVKIIVATDVAKTSLTIPDIKYVIDSGYQRRMELDAEGVQGLALNDSSRADCDQWAGRTGRVADGYYILTGLNARMPHLPYAQRDEYPTPEILRTDFVRNVLRIAAVGLDAATLKLAHPVSLAHIEQAKANLRILGALDEAGNITQLGMRMNDFPLSVSSARMMVEVSHYSERTRAYMAAIAASKEIGGLQYFAYDVGRAWQELTEETSSDLLVQLDIFIAIQGMQLDDPRLKFYDLDVHNIERAREQYRKIAKQVAAHHEVLVPPTERERQDLRRCIYAGLVNSIYKYNGEGTYVHVGNSDQVREISNRSMVRGKHAVLVGDPYRVEYMRGGERQTKPIIEHVTSATLAEIGRVAMHLTEWKSDGLAMRAGGFVDVRRLHLFGADLGIVEELVAEPSPKLREAIITHALEHAGPQQRRLREVKKELERLAHLAKDHVPQLTHDRILEFVNAAAPTDITDPSLIETTLRAVADEHTLERYVPLERQMHIMQNAPETIQVEGGSLSLHYQSRRALVRSFNPRVIAGLREELFLPDGRQIHFVFEGKRRTLFELQALLEIDELAPLTA